MQLKTTGQELASDSPGSTGGGSSSLSSPSFDSERKYCYSMGSTETPLSVLQEGS